MLGRVWEVSFVFSLLVVKENNEFGGFFRVGRVLEFEVPECGAIAHHHTLSTLPPGTCTNFSFFVVSGTLNEEMYDFVHAWEGASFVFVV